MKEFLRRWLFPEEDRFPKNGYYSLVNVVETLAAELGYSLLFNRVGYDGNRGVYEIRKNRKRSRR